MWILYILYHTAHDSDVMKIKRLKTCVDCGRGHTLEHVRKHAMVRLAQYIPTLYPTVPLCQDASLLWGLIS